MEYEVWRRIEEMEIDAYTDTLNVTESNHSLRYIKYRTVVYETQNHWGYQ